jgi:hypothetical protein
LDALRGQPRARVVSEVARVAGRLACRDHLVVVAKSARR